MKTTNYYDTFIEVAEDSPVKTAEIPPERPQKTAVRHQYDLISQHPYRFTSDEILFDVFAAKKAIPAKQREHEKEKFFSRGRACLRASDLCKRYGWGIHHNATGRVAIYAVESDSYKKLASQKNLTHFNAMRSGRG